MTTHDVAVAPLATWVQNGSAPSPWGYAPSQRQGAAPRVGALAIARRYAVLAAVAVVVGALHIARRPATLCLFRELTGLPCPFCGGTTAAVHLGHADFRGALAASPLAVAMFAFGPLLGAFHAPRWWQNRRTRWLTIAAVLIASEIWQLTRFGFIHF